jgi:GntR family transcriptional regulator
LTRRSLPLAEQLLRELADDISSGKIIEENGRLPSETRLQEHYNVSRATVREALAKLELAGVISRQHGVGTYLNPMAQNQSRTIWGWLDEAPAFIDLIQQSGYQAGCELLAVSKKVVDDANLIFNRNSDDTPLVSIEKIFTADGVPFIYSMTLVPYDLLAHNPAAANLDRAVYRKTIFEIFQGHTQQAVIHQMSEIRAQAADEKLAELLNCPVNAPLLLVEEIGYGHEQNALFYAQHYFQGDRVSFRQIRTPTFTVTAAESDQT